MIRAGTPADERSEMEAAVDKPQHTRGAALLIHHCMEVGRYDETRAPATERLEQAVGSEMAQLLLAALVPPLRAAG
jgi:hypothetical protein